MRFSPQMNSHLLTRSVLALALVSTGAMAQTEGLTTTKQKVSYGLGIQIARQLAGQGLEEIDRAAFSRGIEDAIAGNDLAVSPQELQAAFAEYKQELDEERSSKGKAALERGTAFLAKNKAEEGVQELDGGVQYKVLKSGDGPKPKVDDQVEVHYKGMLLDGTEFDSSYARGEPIKLGLGGVIEGWRIALQEMPVGSKWMIWIPATKAYGDRGAGSKIGPNETLNFEIELLAIAGPSK